MMRAAALLYFDARSIFFVADKHRDLIFTCYQCQDVYKTSHGLQLSSARVVMCKTFCAAVSADSETNQVEKMEVLDSAGD